MNLYWWFYFRKLPKEFENLLKNVIEICIENQYEYPEVGEFFERIKSCKLDLKKMDYKIEIPSTAIQRLQDTSLENQLSSLILNKKWNLVADMFMQIPIKKYQASVFWFIGFYFIKFYLKQTLDVYCFLDTVRVSIKPAAIIQKKNKNWLELRGS